MFWFIVSTNVLPKGVLLFMIALTLRGKLVLQRIFVKISSIP